MSSMKTDKTTRKEMLPVVTSLPLVMKGIRYFPALIHVLNGAVIISTLDAIMTGVRREYFMTLIDTQPFLDRMQPFRWYQFL
ncbi:hypothetical protein PENTCL1PPCAC_15031 [Pristionchus entomophagus]|uniref:G protein-coupled receptor n=1 Tax=Pristionchus entomophagus TaxID=358040 RepID=A0AAV5TGW2_9BILA|nr:hypothetical protein PENTCL1PPCAC_15031 [Pristionchus entomophagus]